MPTSEALGGSGNESGVPSSSLLRALRQPRARFIAADGDQELLTLMKTASARDWPALREALSKYSGYDLSSLLSGLWKQPGLTAWLPEAIAGETDDALARTVLGSEAISRAWRVRTSQRAHRVSQEQFRQFHTILREAEEHLHAAAELDGESAAPWYSLLVSGRGLEVGLELQQRRFDAVLARSPGHLGAHQQMLQQLCRKWSGSHERMHAFATEAMRGPHGETLGVLIPRAYVEHFGYLATSAVGRRFMNVTGSFAGRRLMRSARTRSELQEAADLTIFRPGYRPAREPYAAANVFAVAFCTAGMWSQARAAFAATEGVVVDWGGLRDPIAVYTTRRSVAYRRF